MGGGTRSPSKGEAAKSLADQGMESRKSEESPQEILRLLEPGSSTVCRQKVERIRTKFYEFGFQNPERPGSGIYINYDIDEILLDYETWGNYIFGAQDCWYGGIRGFPDWEQGLHEIDDKTRNGIKNLSTVIENINEMYYYRWELRELFRALDRLTITYGVANAFYYRLVSDYHIHQVYNRLFPGHTNHQRTVCKIFR